MKSSVIGFAIMGLMATAGAAEAGWLIYNKPALAGRVVDAETKAAIEGAVVVVTYEKSTVGVPHSYTSIIKVRETVTDKNGEFHIPAYWTLIQPLSVESLVRVLIYKPGYGNFPEQQIVPGGIAPIDDETFFSRPIGTEGQLSLWVATPSGPEPHVTEVTFGIVELPRLTSREERLKSIPSLPSWDRLEEQRELIRAINHEEEALGLEKSDPFKARDFIPQMGK